MIALLHKMSCKEKIRGMGEEEAMQITGTLQSSFLSELKIFFLMRAEKPHVSRSSSHTHSRLALQDKTFLEVEVGGCFLGAVLRPESLFWSG